MEDTRKPSAILQNRDGTTEVIYSAPEVATDLVYVQRQYGRCAVEYRHPHLDTILPTYTQFLYRDQTFGLPVVLESRPMGALSQHFAAHHGFGTYGMNADGTFTLLVKIKDSSD